MAEDAGSTSPRSAEQEALKLLREAKERVEEVVAVQADAFLWLDLARKPWTTPYFRGASGVILGERRKGFVA